MKLAISSALQAHYKAENVVDANYQASVKDVFAVTVKGNNVTTYALGYLPATKSSVVIIVNHSHANASKINASKNPASWKPEQYTAYCDSIDANTFNSSEVGYVVDVTNDKLVCYKSTNAKRVNGNYEYTAYVISANGDIDELTIKSSSRLNKVDLISTIKAEVNGTTINP